MPEYIIKTKSEIAKENLQLTKNFSARELACKHCGDLKIDKVLVERLQKLRDIIGLPINIVSGYRCTKNVPKGSSTRSLHTTGSAADINVGRKMNMIEVFNIAIKLFNRVGIYYNSSGFGSLHGDMGGPRTYWYCDNRIAKYTYFKTTNSLLLAIDKDTKIKWRNILI